MDKKRLENLSDEEIEVSTLQHWDQVAYAAPRSFAFIDSMGRWGAQ